MEKWGFPWFSDARVKSDEPSDNFSIAIETHIFIGVEHF